MTKLGLFQEWKEGHYNFQTPIHVIHYQENNHVIISLYNAEETFVKIQNLLMNLK